MKPHHAAKAIFSFLDGDDEAVVEFRFLRGRHWLVLVMIGEQCVRLANDRGQYKARVVDSLRAIEEARRILDPSRRPAEKNRPPVGLAARRLQLHRGDQNTDSPA